MLWPLLVAGALTLILGGCGGDIKKPPAVMTMEKGGEFRVDLMLAPAGELDGQYTVFGTVASGMEVVDTITLGDKMKTVTIVEAAP